MVLRQLIVTVRGDLAGSKRLALSELARIAEGIQGGLERVALVLRGRGSASSGRRPQDVVDATRLDLVDFERGSSKLVLERHGPVPLFEMELDDAIEALLQGIAGITKAPTELPEGWDFGVIAGLSELTGSIGGGVDSVEIGFEGLPPVVLDATVKKALKAARRSSTEWRRVTGRLHMGDFPLVTLRCRIDLPEWSVLCEFESELRPRILSSMDRVVVAEGPAELQPDGRRIRLLRIEMIEALAEQTPRSVEELVEEQGVRPISKDDALVGEPVDDFDEYIAAIRSLRAE
ncbi:MAG: hypothetical protein WD627_04830 [Actinomycetota bacterium]